MNLQKLKIQRDSQIQFVGGTKGADFTLFQASPNGLIYYRFLRSAANKPDYLQAFLLNRRRRKQELQTQFVLTLDHYAFSNSRILQPIDCDKGDVLKVILEVLRHEFKKETSRNRLLRTLALQAKREFKARQGG